MLFSFGISKMLFGAKTMRERLTSLALQRNIDKMHRNIANSALLCYNIKIEIICFMVY